MALSGNQKAYKQARSGIARSGASRSNYVYPLLGTITVNGLDLTKYVQYHTLKIGLALNEEPDTCSFDVMLTDNVVQSNVTVGVDVVIGLAGSDALFGGRILTAQTTYGLGGTPMRRSVMCADFLQVQDSEYLITYDWPSQSATTTIVDLFARFGNRSGGVVISTAGVVAGLPTHAAFAVLNERFSTVLRKVVTMFDTGGGFYVDPLRVLHVWQGASEPGVTAPTPLTLANPLVKSFAETEDGSQVRDACLVEGARTSAPLGTPGPSWTDPISFPVEDASILDKIHDQAGREVRVGSQRMIMRYAAGPWSSPPANNYPTSSTVASAVAYDPTLSGDNVIILASDTFLLGHGPNPWAEVEGQLLYGTFVGGGQFRMRRTGFGCQTAAIPAGAVISVIDSLGGGTLTGRYDKPGAPETLRAQPIDSDVVMTVRSTTGNAVHEHIVQDGRYTRTGAGNRGASEVSQFKRPLKSIQFETDDLNAKPGRLQVYDLADPEGNSPLRGQYMILTAELTWPVWGQPPRRSCYAADVQAADVTDAWLVDKR